MVVGFEYAWDAAGNKLMQKNLADPLDDQRYGYDAANRLTAMSRGPVPDSGAVEIGSNAWCDAPTSPTRIELVASSKWTLDGLGNWDAHDSVTSGVATRVAARNTNFNEYWAQVTTVGAGAPTTATSTHDANGNLTADGESLRKGVAGFIERYNIRRPHSSLGGATPDEAWRGAPLVRAA